MLRRTFLLTTFLLPPLAWAQSGAVGRIAILRELVDAIGAAGEAISKLTAGFKDLVVTSAAGYNYVSAERERSHLIDISRRTTNLIVTQNVRVVQSLDEYLEIKHPSDEDWRQVIGNVDSTLVTVHTLLSDVQSEKSDFVLEPAFATLNRTLAGRVSLLQQLSHMGPPTTLEERKLLAQASEKYKVLIANAERAVVELNAYVKARK